MTHAGTGLPEHAQLSRVTLAEAAANAIREMIVTGELPVGTRIRQDEFATRLGVSRTPMREALAKLAAEGLVVNDAHRNAVVARPSLAEIEEVYEIREVLEALAASIAAENRTAEDVEELMALVAAIDAAPVGEEWVRRNAEFHSRLYTISGRNELLKLLASLRMRTEVYVRLLVEAGHAVEAQADHRAIVAGVEARDPEATAAVVRRHVRRTYELIAEVIRSDRNLGDAT
jgi:DNA-binding GntR family transcriptional regulator